MKKSLLLSLIVACACCAATEAAVTATYDGGDTSLTVIVTGGTPVTVGVDGSNNVTVNGANPLVSGVPTAVPAATVGVIEVRGDSASDSFNTSAVTAGVFTTLGIVVLTANGGTGQTLVTGPTWSIVNSLTGSGTVQFDASTGNVEFVAPASYTVTGSGAALLSFYGLDSIATAEAIALSASGANFSLTCTGPTASAITSSITLQEISLNPGVGNDSVTVGDLTGTPGAGIDVAITLLNGAGAPDYGDKTVDSSLYAGNVRIQPVTTGLAGINASVNSAGYCSVVYSSIEPVGIDYTVSASGADARVQTGTAMHSYTGFDQFTVFAGSASDHVTVNDLTATSLTDVYLYLEDGNDDIATIRAQAEVTFHTNGGAGSADKLQVITGASYTQDTDSIDVAGAAPILLETDADGAWELFEIHASTAAASSAWSMYE